MTFLAGVVTSGIVGNSDRSSEVGELHRVAHAGGEIDGATYTNSREAILESLAKGFDWIEVDFTWTSDGRLVCIHDWESNYRRLFKTDVEEPLSLQAFEAQRSRSDFSLLTLSELGELMNAHPRLKIVTDIKENNLTGLDVIAQKLPDSASRVIPQIYVPGEYESVRELGYEQIIWTLYRYSKQGDIEQILREIKSMKLVAVCMSRQRVADGHAKRLKARGIATYAHTINEPEEWKDLRENWGVTQVYTDFLPAND